MGNSISYTVSTFGSSYFCYLEAIESNGIDESIISCLTQEEFKNDLLSIIGVTNKIHILKFQNEFEKYLLNRNKSNENNNLIINDNTLPSAPPLVGNELDPTPAIPSNYLKRSESMMNQIECSLCLCTMNDPCTLNCGHSSCIECIRESIRNNFSSCSICRQEFLTSEKNNKGNDLKVNISLRNLIDRIDPEHAAKRELLEIEKNKKIKEEENKKIKDEESKKIKKMNDIENAKKEAKRLGGNLVENKNYATYVVGSLGKYTGIFILFFT